MAQGKPIPASMLTNYVVVMRAGDGTDEYGDLDPTSIIEVGDFWADIKEVVPTADIWVGQQRLSRQVKITCRTDDAELVQLGDIVRFGNLDRDFEVVSLYESDWRYGLTIEAEYKN